MKTLFRFGLLPLLCCCGYQADESAGVCLLQEPSNSAKSVQTLLDDSRAQNAVPTRQIDFDPLFVLEEVAGIVAESFYDPNFDDRRWRRQVDELSRQITKSETRDDFAAHINRLLKNLNTSHTFYFAKSDPKRYQILSIFQLLVSDDEDESYFVYPGIGIDTQSIDQRHIILAVYDGFSASRAGLMFGDEILNVDHQPFHPIDSFVNKLGKSVMIEFKREGQIQQVETEVQSLDGRTMFIRALEASERVYHRNDKKIGYLHAWSYAGSHYHEIIRQSILWGELSDCDALILDLRDGWGGADLNYLNLFRPPIAEIKSKSRSEEARNFSGVWGKPVVLLINQRTTSGKELFAYGFKKLGLGKMVGDRTAGAVVAGRCFLLSNGDALYVAVSDIEIDGIRLEGLGVDPDIDVPRPVPENSPVIDNRVETLEVDLRDPQLKAALEYLSDN